MALIVILPSVSAHTVAGDDTAGNQAGIGITLRGRTGEYSLTVTSTPGGRVTEPGEGTFDYTDGTTVSLTATADAGFRFVEWTGDVGTVDDTSSATTVITMLGHYAITAAFEGVQEVGVRAFSLSINSTAGGSVTAPAEGTFVYPEGSEVNLEATPADGFQFVAWTGDVETIADAGAAVTTIVIEGDHSITAAFAEVASVEPRNRGLIIGMIAAGVVTPVAIMFVRRRRKPAGPRADHQGELPLYPDSGLQDE